MKAKKLVAVLACLCTAVTLGGCSASVPEINLNEAEIPEEEIVTEEEPKPAEDPVIAPEIKNPTVKTVTYVKVNSDGVNLRSGAGTGYAVLGTAEKSTLYAYLGEQNGWYKTQYKNRTAYVSAKYCVLTNMDSSGNEQVEAVIAEGARLLGTPYVYGAVRYHDGKGNKLKNFTVSEFDCSSLMQYIFYRGADKLLDVTTRTQIKQGVTVKKSQLKRGDLMFFTNASRKNNTGIERVGHVALYLGDNKILHTASDYAKIEEISPLRWSYFIQGQRML